jgi:hypothetical protein
MALNSWASGSGDYGSRSYSQMGLFCASFRDTGESGGKYKPGEITMRKIALLAAVALSAAFANTSTSYAATDAEFYNLNKNTHLFVRDAWNPYAATSKPAAAPAKKVSKKKMKM